MGIGDFFKEVGDGIATGIAGTARGLNVVDRYINPLHKEVGNKQFPVSEQDAQANQGLLYSPVVASGINPSVEAAAAGMKWLRDNGVSQPLSTFMLVGKQADSTPSTFFSADAWSKAWHAANHISPGQAALLGGTVFNNPDTGAAQAQKAIDSKLVYYQPATSFLPAGWDRLPYDQQQSLLKKMGMPATGNAYVESKRKDSGLYKYGSGALDFGAAWYLDPTIVAGKGASALRASKFKVTRPAAGWSGEDIAGLMAKSNVKRMVDGIWEHRDNPQLLNNTELARTSAMGPRFGAVAATLQSPEEVQLFVRTGMGDAAAMDQLKATNALAASRLEQDTSRLAALDLMHTRYDGMPTMQALVQQEMDRLNAGINADTALVNRYDAILSHSDELNQLAVSRWSFARAAERTDAQNVYTAGAARFGGATRQRTASPSAPGKFFGVPFVTTAERPAGQGLFGTAELKSTPLSSGMIKSHVYGVDGFFGGPVALVRMLKNARPNGYMQIDDITSDAVAELRGHLARIPGVTPATRQSVLNDYLKTTTEAERKDILENVGRLGAAKVAEKHGLSAEDGAAIFKEHMARQSTEKARLAGRGAEDERYTGATDPTRTGASGQPLYVDEFTTDGGKVVVSPFSASRIMNDHTFQDLDLLDKTLARHSSALKALRTGAGSSADFIANSADYLSYLWKFSTLFRLGYIPRVMSDDLAGQVARLGAATMAMRFGYGVKNGVTNASTWLAKPWLQANEHAATAGASYADEELKLLRPELEDLRTRGAATPAEAAHLQQMEDRAQMLETYQGLKARQAADWAAKQKKVIQGSEPIEMGGHTFPAAFGGERGDYFQKLITSGESIGNLFNDNRLLVQGNLERSFSHGAKPITAAQDEAEHALAWTHAINHVIMQDAASRMAVQGASAEQIAQWMTRTAQGRAYRARLPKMIQTEDLAHSIKTEVDQYLHTPEIRAKALEPDGVTPQFLKDAVPLVHDRPQVHIAQMGQGSLRHANAMDRVIQRWYKLAAEMPANRMSRHPLYNQLYEGHLKSIVNSRMKQGAWERRTVADVDQMTESARRLALNDTRKLVFDIAHRSDAAAALRFISPFFSATSEAFQRWSRILADKPQVAGYAGQFFNAPLGASGLNMVGFHMRGMQDADGNMITPDGNTYTVDPKTGKAVKRLVPKSERYIIARMPKWLVSSPIGIALGAEQASGNLALSQNSMNLVTQGDPWFSPGVGPIVQIPVNALVQDKPTQAEMARQLGILPFGPATGSATDQFYSMVAPKTVRDFLTGFDTSDERYQAIKLQITQRAAYEHDNLHKPMPSASEIASMTRKYWMFSAASAFMQPMATQRKDAYQFYRDQYNNLRRQDAMTADDKFLEKYGESYFVFAQSQSKNASGIPATMKAVDLQKKYGDLIAASPELAALIIGPEGNGPFSPEAYSYQINNPLVPGEGEAARTKMSATEAMNENQRREGWTKFTKNMNRLTAQLHGRGLTSFEDAGAEDLKQEKSNYISLYAEPLYPDGTSNPYYNEQWSKDWFSLDARKYDRLIPGLTKLAQSPLAAEKSRSDLRVLQQYLGGRKAVLGALAARDQGGGSKTLVAKANADLASQWTRFVDGLVESDTSFGDLYHRYLSRDLGVDAAPETTQGGA